MAKNNVLISFDKGLDTYNEPQSMDPQAVTRSENSIQQGSGELDGPSWGLTVPADWDSTGKVYNVGSYLTNANSTDIVLHGQRTQYELPGLWAQAGVTGGATLFPWEQKTYSVTGQAAFTSPSGTAPLPTGIPQCVVNTLNNVAFHINFVANGVDLRLVYRTQNLNTNAVSVTSTLTVTSGSVNCFCAGICYDATLTNAYFVVLTQNTATNVITVRYMPATFGATLLTGNTVSPGATFPKWSAATFNKDLYIATGTSFTAASTLYRITYAAITGVPATMARPADDRIYASLYSTSPFDATGELSYSAYTLTGPELYVRHSNNPPGGAGTWTAENSGIISAVSPGVHVFHVPVTNIGSRIANGWYVFQIVNGSTTFVAAAYEGQWWSLNTVRYLARGAALITGLSADYRIQGNAYPYTHPFVPAHGFRTLPTDPSLYHAHIPMATDSTGFNLTSTPFQQQRDSMLKILTLPNRSSAFAATPAFFTLSAVPALRESFYAAFMPSVGAANGVPLTPIVYETATSYNIGISVFTVKELLTLSPELATFGTIVPTVVGVNLISLECPKDFSALNAPIQLGKSIIFPGLIQGGFDGTVLKEFGNFTRPPPITVSTATTGGSMTTGLYYYKASITYTDSRGQIHEGPYSYPVSITTGATATNTVTVTVGLESLLFALESSTAVFVPRAINIWRTTANPGVVDKIDSFLYFKVGVIVTNANANNLNQAFIDVINDTTARTRTRSRNSAGQDRVDRFTPPPFLSHAVFQQRLWGLSYENGYNLYVSYAYIDQNNPDGVGFGASTRVDVPVDVGEVKSICGLDGAVIVFGSGADYSISGNAQNEGEETPTQLNIQGPMPSPGGMISRNSWVRIPDGVLYQSEQGLILYGRGGGYKYFGKNARGLTQTNLYGRGVLVASDNYVYFPSLTAPVGTEAIGYNYLENNWFTFKAVLSPAGWNAGVQIRTASNPVAAIVSRAPFGYYTLNKNVSDQKVIETPWLQPGGQSGYGEVSDMVILGAYQGPHILQVEEAWDYGPYSAPRQQVVLNDPGDYQYRFSPYQTQVRAIRYRITVTPINSAGTPALNGKMATLFGIMLELGGDNALSRLANTRNR